MAGKIAVCGLNPQELCENLAISPSFRGKQIFGWIAKGVTSFEEMKNLDKATIALLNEKAVLRSSKVGKVLRDSDGTIKLQIILEDSRAVETVLLTDREGRKTACVSCQAGCAMGCLFCKTGTLGLGRNLTAAEIVEEFFFLEKEAGKLAKKVHAKHVEKRAAKKAAKKAAAAA